MIGQLVGPFVMGIGLNFVARETKWKERLFGTALFAAGLAITKYL